MDWPWKKRRWEIDALKRALFKDTIRRMMPAPLKPLPREWSDTDLTCSWLGHSTVLINFYGLNILTDPVLGKRIGIKAGPFVLGPKRYVKPALTHLELPRVDLVLLSHSHLDHLDLWTLRRINSQAMAVTSKNTADLLSSTRIQKIHELGWHEDLELFSDRGGLRIHAFPTHHWGARMRTDHHRGWNGYILERNGTRLLFGGDTGYTPIFEGLAPRGPFEIAIMPIGSYRPWHVNHCTPEQALAMADAAGAEYLVPIHHQTFKLSWEPMSEPIERLQKALSLTPKRLAIRQIGETFVLPRKPVPIESN